MVKNNRTKKKTQRAANNFKYDEECFPSNSNVFETKVNSNTAATEGNIAPFHAKEMSKAKKNFCCCKVWWERQQQQEKGPKLGWAVLGKWALNSLSH